MKNSLIVKLVKIFTQVICGVLFAVSMWGLPAFAADKIPALAFITDNLPITPETRTILSERRAALQQELKAFQNDAKRFDAKPPEEQSDAELYALQDRRSKYISKANTFNADVAEAVTRGVKRDSLPASRLASLRGECYYITKDGEKIKCVVGGNLPMDGGTRVVLGENSKLQLLLPDETVFTLGPNSDMVLDDFVFDPATPSYKLNLDIKKGTFRWVSGHQIRRQVNIKTKSDALGFRGTDFDASFDAEGAGYVKLYEGKLDITPIKTGKTFELKAGEKIIITANGISTSPTPLSRNDKENRNTVFENKR